MENASLLTPVERAPSPFGSEHSDAKVGAGLQSGLCDLFKSSQGCEKLSLRTRDHPLCYLSKLQTSSTIYPVSKGFSELMKIFGNPTFQLKTSTSQEAYSEVLRSFIKEAVCYL